MSEEKVYAEMVVTLRKFVPYTTEILVELEGDSVRDLEDQAYEIESLDGEELAVRVLEDENWWEDKHGWHCMESEVIHPDDLWDTDPEFELPDFDSLRQEIEDAKEAKSNG
tara:strand:- start:10862 stop:11194 length:333 start_codon:yes stop_codon:yes gene_type:complete